MLAVRYMRGYRALVHVVLAAFIVQGFVTQGHMHWGGAGQEFAAVASHAGAATTDATKAGSKQTPANRDHSNCPICHAASVAGAMFASAAPILRVPSLSTLVPERDERSIVVERFTAAWRSRAPPSV